MVISDLLLKTVEISGWLLDTAKIDDCSLKAVVISDWLSGIMVMSGLGTSLVFDW